MIRVNMEISYHQIHVDGASGYELAVLIKKCWAVMKKMWPEWEEEIVNDVLTLTDEELVDMLRKRGYFVKRSNVDW